MVVFRFLFWTWVLVSLAIFVYRRWNHSMARRAASNDTAPSPVVTDAGSRPDWFPASDAPTATVPPPQPPLSPRSGPGEDPLPPASAPFEAPPPGGTLFDPPPPDGSGLPGSGPSPPRPGASRTIAEVLTGIEMPAGLLPYLDAEPHPGTLESVAFVTADHDAATVGQAIGAELRRLGFEIQPVTASRVVATHDGDAVEVAIHASPSTFERSGTKAFPTAREGQVIVEIWR